MPGLQCWSTATALAFLLGPTVGCSWIFVNKPYESTNATAPTECTSSVAAPVVDTVAAGLIVGGAATVIVQASNEHSDPFLSGLSTTFAVSAGLVAAAAAVPLAFSAAYGYSTTSECRRLEEKRRSGVAQLSCVSGVEASCLGLEEWRPE